MRKRVLGLLMATASMAVTSSDGLQGRRLRLWKRVRRLIPPRARWFYEGSPHLRGQLWHADRRALYTAIRTRKPEVVVEIGTWLGGGSTYFIAQALHDNGGGVLHTTETQREFHESAMRDYHRHLPHLLPHVQFHFGPGDQVLRAILPGSGRVDAVFQTAATIPGKRCGNMKC